ncbi:MAG TPA: penicillin-binding transpeptidase domain-containing protein, partial [Puia sp.]
RLVGHYQDQALDTPAIAGKNLNTYLDIELQQLAERLLYGKTGAVVAIEPSTGGILAMASGPNFDPNSLTGPDKQSNYGRLALDASGPLLNRAIKGQYPAGSTYKPIGALIGLDEGVINPASGINCLGSYNYCAKAVRCLEKWPGHAANLRLAIAHSCNSFFCNTFRLTVDNPEYHSVRQGLTRWKNYVNAFGLGHRLGVDLPSEDGGNIPDTAVYDKDYNHAWNSCTMVTMGIGQDKMLITPLQMANAMCIVANKGYYYTPHFVRSIGGAPEDDTLLSRFHQKHEPVTHISDAAYEVVHSGMQDVMEVGTGKSVLVPGINICAKTGTAENKQRIDGRVIKLKDHSVFVCFAPRENPRIAVAVVVENGGTGASQAGPIATLLVEKYLRDTLSLERLAKVDEVAGRNIMPRYLVRVQFREDSNRAAIWARQSGDSSRLIKYQTPSFRAQMMDTSEGSRSPIYLALHRPSPYKSAVAERLAQRRAQAAASEAHQDSAQKAVQAPDSTKKTPQPRRRDSLAPPPRPAHDSSTKPADTKPTEPPVQKDSTNNI